MLCYVMALVLIWVHCSFRNFTQNWVANAKVAKLKTKSATSHLSFDQQCRFCEKVSSVTIILKCRKCCYFGKVKTVSLNLLQESINQSLLNLLSYPWIEDRVRKELVSIHGGYYDFSNCSFEKWTLDFKECNVKEEKNSYIVKEKELWCWGDNCHLGFFVILFYHVKKIMQSYMNPQRLALSY